LARAIATFGMNHLTDGSNGLLLRKGIERASTEAIEILSGMAQRVKNKKEIEQVATLSAESVELGKIIAATIHTVGKDGVVTVEDSHEFGVTSEVVEGMAIDSGFVSHYMLTDKERMEAVFRNVAVLVTDRKISAIVDIVPMLEKLAAAGKKELVIIAEDIEGEALTTIVLNKMRGIFSVLAIKSSGFGDRKLQELQDIATLVGATVVTESLVFALENADTTVLGRAGKIISTVNKTVIVEGKGKKSAIKEHILGIKAHHSQIGTSKLDRFTKQHLEKRIAKLQSGIAVIRVGAATETESKYLKLKIEDAINATKAAIEEGIVPGGGVSFVKISEALSKKSKVTLYSEKKEVREGYQIVVDALTAPFRQITQNAGFVDIESLLQSVKNSEGALGYDASADTETERVLVDMIKVGIIDPVKVTRTALQNAASAAGILLTTDVAIADDEETIKQKLSQQEQ